MHNREQQDP